MKGKPRTGNEDGERGREMEDRDRFEGFYNRQSLSGMRSLMFPLTSLRIVRGGTGTVLLRQKII